MKSGVRPDQRDQDGAADDGQESAQRVSAWPGTLARSSSPLMRDGRRGLPNWRTKRLPATRSTSRSPPRSAPAARSGPSTPSSRSLQFDIDQATRALATKKGDPDLTAQLGGALQDRTVLKAKANELQINSIAFGDGLAFIDLARVPSHPSEPQPLRNAGVAALFGLLIAGAVAWSAPTVIVQPTTPRSPQRCSTPRCSDRSPSSPARTTWLRSATPPRSWPSLPRGQRVVATRLPVGSAARHECFARRRQDGLGRQHRCDSRARRHERRPGRW